MRWVPTRRKLTLQKQAVLDAVKSHPGSSISEIAYITGYAPNRVNQILKELQGTWRSVRSSERTRRVPFSLWYPC